jgi:hypothetical protein
MMVRLLLSRFEISSTESAHVEEMRSMIGLSDENLYGIYFSVNSLL